MTLRSSLLKKLSTSGSKTVTGRKPLARTRPRLEWLEERMVLSTLTVTNLLDDGSTGSLRWAVTQANTGTGDDTIDFDSTVFASAQTITLGGTQLELTDTTGVTTITGPTAGVTISGNNASRVFKISGATAAFTGLTISGGNSGNGGGLMNDHGTTTITNCTISGNTVSGGGSGGGVLNFFGSLTLTNSTVSGNTVTETGGGAGLFSYRGPTTLTNCTISGNTAAGGGGGIGSGFSTLTLTGCTISVNSSGTNGGGILTDSSTLTLTNSTIGGNSTAGGSGGGLLSSFTTATLTNCTISGNTVTGGGGGGGIYRYNGSATLTNTIVAGNETNQATPDVNGSFSSQGHNLIGIIGYSYGWVSTDLTGTFRSPLKPYLSALGNYGGPTQTYALLPGSPAIDAGTSTNAPTTDQRGLGRVGGVDIGAFESQGFTVSLVAGSTPQSADIGTPFTNPLAVTVTANNPVEPVNGGIVNYEAQPDQNGARAIFLTSPAVIAGGQANMPAMPNNVLGSSTAVGNVGSSSATFSLTNTGQVIPSLVVNTTSNNPTPGVGILSLPEAVLLASADPTGGQTISFDSSVFATPQTITLSGTQLELAKDMTITGPAAGVTVDANHVSRVLMIDANVTATISNLTFTGGSLNNADGSGVYNAGMATLDHCSITTNSATVHFAWSWGGGIYNAPSATLMLMNSTVSGNTMSDRHSYGAGIFNDGTATLTNTFVSGNTTDGDGGGVYNNGTLSIENTTITGNTAVRDGGGVYNNGSLSVDNTTISGNTALSDGGGIYNDDTLTIINTTISGNTADSDGGGIYNNGTLSIENTTISGNTADSEGGGIYNSGTLSVHNTTISGNTSGGDGGGIYNCGPLSVDNTTVSGNTADSDGGGLYNYGGPVTITNSTFSGNTATGYGGGISAGDEISLINSTITGNSADQGGGLYVSWGTTHITNCTISGNSADKGGGLYNNSGSTATVTNTIVAGNTATTAAPDTYGTWTSQGYNLIGQTDGSTGWVSSDLTGTTASPLDAMLAPLGNYGGPTQTMALLPGSPAINAGTSTGAPTTDQRGASRVGGVDIGAFESQGFTLSPVAGSTPQAAYVDEVFSQGLGVTVTANNPVEPVNGGFLTFNTPGSGASAVLSAGKIVIAGGAASATATANHTPGAYNVTANASGAPTAATFALTNTIRSSTTTLSSSTNPSAQGSSVTFTATVTSGATGTVTFKDGSTVLGTVSLSGNTATFSTSTLTAGSHTITAVYNSDGSYATSTSNAITQVVAAAPLVTSNPTGRTVNAGTTATFTAAAIGNPAPSVQWQISTNGGSSWANISGATSASYTTPATSAGNDGAMYRAVFVNSLGSASTSAATLRVNQAPAVSTQPASVTTNTGSTATFTAAATGSPAPTVQWQSNSGGGWADIPGATSTSYSTLASGNNGTQFRAVFTNTFGTATSNAATLNIAVVANVSSTSVGWGSQTANLVDAGNGRLLPAGRTTSIPWLGINKVMLTLNQSIASLAAGDVTVRGVAGFTYSVASVTGSGTTWTINLAGTGLANPDKVTVTVGNSNLASYSKRLDVLPGDVNDDGLVSVADQMLVSRQLTGQYIVFYDIDGTGTLTSDDVSKIKARIGNKLPA